MSSLVDFFYSFLLRRHIEKNQNQVKEIERLQKNTKCFLVISNTALGDTILSTPAIKSLRESFPNSKIIAILNKNIIPMFKGYKYVDVIIPFFGGYHKFINTVNIIKTHRPEVALIFHGNGPQDIQLALLSGCSYILKHPTNSNLKKYLSFDFIKKNQHTIEDRLDLVRKIKGGKINTNMNLPVFNDNKLIDKYGEFKNFIGLQIGAADVYKIWPIKHFIKLAEELINDDDNVRIVITGIKKESYLADMIVRGNEKHIVNMCGKCKINELPYLIQDLKVLITNDTGTMHLAVALKVPTVSLFSPTSSSGIGPYQDLNIHEVVQKDGGYMQKLPKKQRSNQAMELINPSEVFKKYLEKIK
jgi:ADP-heptose:LPS heptosyltransferase